MWPKERRLAAALRKEIHRVLLSLGQETRPDRRMALRRQVVELRRRLAALQKSPDTSIKRVPRSAPNSQP